jgi:hypothetical protein
MDASFFYSELERTICITLICHYIMYKYKLQLLQEKFSIVPVALKSSKSTKKIKGS